MRGRIAFFQHLLLSLSLLVGLGGASLQANEAAVNQSHSSSPAQATQGKGKGDPTIIIPPDPAGAYILSPANSATVYVNQAVSFSGSTDNGTSFTWTFGDGSTATGLTATHTYTATGTYTVSFKASATGYTASTTSISLTVAPPPNTAPVISSFTASPSSIAAGGSSTLSWNTSYATSLSISNVGTVTGTSVVVKPSATTTYRLTATNSVGSVYKDVTVTIVPPPTIASFSASPATIGLGQTSTLSWSTTNATTLSISGIGTVTGTSLAVKPAVTTTYTLTATNVAGTATKSLTVTVVQPPVISSFTASPQIIKAGQSSTLSWTVTGATSLSISGIGTVTGTSLAVTPAVTTTYTLTATNLAGGATALITVKVPPKLTWKGDRVYGFGKLLSEDKPGATAGTVQSTYVQTDQVESVSIVTDATGVVLTRTKNLPSGERYAQSGTVPAFERYAAHEDAQGYSIYMQARTYLPMYGRFAQPDPIYDSVNLYEYSSNSPANALDPSGLADVESQGKIDGDPFSDPALAKRLHEEGYAWAKDPKTGFCYKVPQSTQVNDRIVTGKDSSFIISSVVPESQDAPQNPSVPAEKPSSGNGPTYVTNPTLASRTQSRLDKVSNGLTVAQHIVGNTTIAIAGSKAGKVYWHPLSRGFYGNQYVNVARADQLLKTAGHVVFIVQTGTTLYQIHTGEVTVGKGAIDIGVSALGTFAGPGGAIISITKSGVEAQWKNDGGWGQFFRDAGHFYGDNAFGRALTSAGDYYTSYKE